MKTDRGCFQCVIVVFSSLFLYVLFVLFLACLCLGVFVPCLFVALFALFALACVCVLLSCVVFD